MKMVEGAKNHNNQMAVVVDQENHKNPISMVKEMESQNSQTRAMELLKSQRNLIIQVATLIHQVIQINLVMRLATHRAQKQIIVTV
ncbi:Uncharacterised protein [Mycobacteroides abscessus]|nr:Uncharacterised protein [Mycobacteroides abscessus]